MQSDATGISRSVPVWNRPQKYCFQKTPLKCDRLCENTFISKKLWKNIKCKSEICHIKKVFGHKIIEIWASFSTKIEIGFLVDFCKNFMDILWLFFGHFPRLWLGICSGVVSHNLSMKIYQNSTKIGFLFQGKIKMLPCPWVSGPT